MTTETLHGDSPAPASNRSILIADDDSTMQAALSESVRRLGYDVHLASDGHEALERAMVLKPWLVLSDLKMPRLGGIPFVRELKKRLPETTIVLMTAYGTVETAVEAMKVGASDYLLKPFSADLLERILTNLQGSDADPSDTEAARTPQRPILTQDPGMIRLLSTAESVAASQATVLITGESGTGKELLARFVHSRSPRAHRPFVAVNCAALPEGLLESELFGHERGAFTGALGRKQGKFEMAHQGTLLLDEISEMNLGLQAKLLRVLQEREVDRIGGREPIPIDVRVIATTNRALAREVEQGRFREDLFYRLNVLPLSIPPLRERPTDIPLLARHFIKCAALRNGVPVPAITDTTMKVLLTHLWKGNVRELENVIERATLLSQGEAIRADLLFGEGAVPAPVFPPVSVLGGEQGRGSLWEMERDLIFKTLARTKDNRTHAARELGISVRTLRNKLREYRAVGQELVEPQP